MNCLQSKIYKNRNLRKIFSELNRNYFEGKISAQIVWGRNKTPAFWGEYYRKNISINPLLNQQWVPMGFLRYTVYHEMLHQVVPSKTTPGGRVYHHTSRFTKREKRFYRAQYWDKWERANIHRFRKIKGDFKKHCHRFGLETTDYGRLFWIKNKLYKIIGLWPWSQFYPIVAKNYDGKIERFAAKRVKKNLLSPLPVGWGQ